jgi:hypothetical protein
MGESELRRFRKERIEDDKETKGQTETVKGEGSI